MLENTTTVQTQQYPSKLNPRPTSSRRVLNIMLWLFQVLLAFQFAAGGFLKVSGDPTMGDMFAVIGVGQWFRYAVGVLEVAGAVGLLVPRLSGLAALGLVGLMVGAALTNTLVLSTGPWLPVVLLVASALIAWGRWPQTRALVGRIKR